MTSAGVEVEECPVCSGQLEPAFQKDGFELASCRTCGLLMRRRLPAREELAAIYAPEYFRYEPDDPVDGYADYTGGAEDHREAARRRLALIERFAPARGRLLDVGAAAGFFVDEALLAGWAAEGVDVAEHMVEWGRDVLGVPLVVGDITAVKGAGAYAAVTMWDYIEHSLDPAADLAKANELLHARGIVALSTGDVDSVVARVSRSRWHLLTPRHHNFFFSARTLARLLVRTGFDVLWVGHPGSRYSLAHLAYKSAPAALAWRIASSRIGRRSLSVNLFDIVTVVGQKA